jgi:hypothetical protein
MSKPNDDGAWFAPKPYGYGSGLPLVWQGWALLLVYIIAMIAATLLIPISIIAFATVAVLLTALIILISARTTRGGWRWRWNGKRQ